mmetsp:Transcript_14664/g.13168  ORF Transcript_14664/g.13168 Transcript_14664/m.13168 type:complete len:190 (+) Transcript_14664:28-597(+)|eukprot:CAMPEP_0201584542 /NCGR_PEP_ID=MMETSP0190_2-20130828/112024_1 /ASSEMBLY_ACC=CAM_ASM_000263 /TAXON_ID=37353 /ORGANISM="Rosalina sp." /LENGTH=189 /DNA_ID=CAMNT_0048028731 /DNA_START=25 /DNA_END=594 /DNA_ORIENTATION=-
MATDPLQTEQQSLLKQSPDNIVISRSACKIITCFVVLFVIATTICIGVLFSIVLEDDESTSGEKRVVGSMPVVGPYSTIIEGNGLLFLSGQIAVDENGTISDGDVVEQTEIVLASIKQILEDAGSNMNKVLKCTVFLANISDFGDMNGVYMEYFNISSDELDSYPARAAFAVRDLPLGAQVEIEAIALP